VHVAGTHLVFYAHTKFDEDILIRGGDMPLKRKSKNAPWRRNSTSGSKVDPRRRLGDFRMGQREKFQRDRTIGVRVMSI